MPNPDINSPIDIDRPNSFGYSCTNLTVGQQYFKFLLKKWLCISLLSIKSPEMINGPGYLLSVDKPTQLFDYQALEECE